MSVLLRRYIYDRNRFNNRQNLLYLEGLINDTGDTGIVFEENVFLVKENFEKLLSKLGLPEKYGLSEVNDELLFRVTADEYRNGSYDSAREFLYYDHNFAEKIGFPYSIEYSPTTDEYTAEGMSPAETEETALEFLKNKGISVNNDKNK